MAVFFSDMGPRPSKKHSLDRINNDGNYEPGNCHWATSIEQAANKNHRRISYLGESLLVREWAEKLGISQFTIFRRLKLGWPVEKVLSKEDCRASLLSDRHAEWRQKNDPSPS